jgi:hypothetical protein
MLSFLISSSSSSFNTKFSISASRIQRRAYSVSDANVDNSAGYLQASIGLQSDLAAYASSQPAIVKATLTSDTFGSNSHSDSGVLKMAVENYSIQVSNSSNLWISEDDYRPVSTSLRPISFSEVSESAISRYIGYTMCDVLKRVGGRDFSSRSLYNARLIIANLNASAMVRLCSYSIMTKNCGGCIADIQSLRATKIRVTPYIERLLQASITQNSTSSVAISSYSDLTGHSQSESDSFISTLNVFARHEVYVGGSAFYEKQFTDAFKHIPGECDSNMVKALAAFIFNNKGGFTIRNIKRAIPELNAVDCELLSKYLMGCNLSIFQSQLTNPMDKSMLSDIIGMNNTVMSWNGDESLTCTFAQFVSSKNVTDTSWHNISMLREDNAIVINQDYDVNNVFFAYVYAINVASCCNEQTQEFQDSQYTQVDKYTDVINCSENYRWLSLVMFGRSFETKQIDLPALPLNFDSSSDQLSMLRSVYPTLQYPVKDQIKRSYTSLACNFTIMDEDNFNTMYDLTDDWIVDGNLEQDIQESDTKSWQRKLSSEAQIAITDSTTYDGLLAIAKEFKVSSGIISSSISSFKKNISSFTDVTIIQTVKLTSEPKDTYGNLISAAAVIGTRTKFQYNQKAATLALAKVNFSSYFIDSLLESIYCKQAYGRQNLRDIDVVNIIKNVPKVIHDKNPIKKHEILAICIPTCTGKTTLANCFPEYLIDIDDLIKNDHNSKEMMNNIRNQLFSVATEIGKKFYLNEEKKTLTALFKKLINERKLANKVILIHSPKQVEEIPEIIIAGCIKLNQIEWSRRIEERRLVAKSLTRFDENVRMAKEGSERFTTVSPSLLKLLPVLIAHKYSK